MDENFFGKKIVNNKIFLADYLTFPENKSVETGSSGIIPKSFQELIMDNNKNMGMTDRYIRFLLGVGFLVNIPVTEPGFLGLVVLLVLGLLMIKSSVTGHCPAYVPFKICTAGRDCPPQAEGKAE